MTNVQVIVISIATIHTEVTIAPVTMDTDYKDYFHAWVGYQYQFCFQFFNVIAFFARLIDIDECLENIAGCSDTCHNTIGSFYCTCFDGYELEFEKGTECLGQLARSSILCSFKNINITTIDINECKFDNGGCTDLCTNTPGSYTCQCEDGFALAVDKHSCYGTNNYSIYIARSAIIMVNDGIDSKL